MRYGLDYLSPLPLAEVKSLGASFVIRYTGTLTKDEAIEMTMNGIDIVLVHETSGTSYQGGEAAGELEAHDAVRRALECGMVGGHPIIFAPADTDLTPNPSAADDYFRGVRKVLPLSRIWGYQGVDLVRRWFDQGLISGAMQTSAWSAEGHPLAWEPRAAIRQYAYERGYDRDEAVLEPFGQWKVGQPVSHPTKTPNLAYLTRKERATVNAYEHEAKHHILNSKRLRALRAELVTMRQAVWQAANAEGLTADAWADQERSKRYLELCRVTGFTGR